MPVNLEIVSPEKLLLSRPVDMVVIPASEGDMGVLEGHAPIIVMLRGGVIALYEGEQVTDQLYVAGGFAEVTPERCTVLANEVLPPRNCRARKASAAWPRRKQRWRRSMRGRRRRGTGAGARAVGAGADRGGGWAADRALAAAAMPGRPFGSGARRYAAAVRSLTW